MPLLGGLSCTLTLQHHPRDPDPTPQVLGALQTTLAPEAWWMQRRKRLETHHKPMDQILAQIKLPHIFGFINAMEKVL